MLFAGVASASGGAVGIGIRLGGFILCGGRKRCRAFGARVRLGGLIFRWSDAQLRFHRRDPRVEFGNLLLHAVQQRLLLIAQLFQLLLDTLALLDVG